MKTEKGQKEEKTNSGNIGTILIQVTGSNNVEMEPQKRKGFDMKSNEMKSSEMKSSEMKSSEMKSSEMKSSEMKSSEMKISEMKISEMKSNEMKSSEMKSSKMKSAEDMYIDAVDGEGFKGTLERAAKTLKGKEDEQEHEYCILNRKREDKQRKKDNTCDRDGTTDDIVNVSGHGSGISTGSVHLNGLPNDGLPNDGLPNDGLPNDGLPNDGLPNDGLPNDGLPNDGLPNDGLPNDGLPNDGLPNDGLPNDGLLKNVEFHKIYESDDNHVSRKNSTVNVDNKSSQGKTMKTKKKNSNIILNTSVLQSYIHKSYDKVSTALIKTSKSFLGKNSNTCNDSSDRSIDRSIDRSKDKSNDRYCDRRKSSYSEGEDERNERKDKYYCNDTDNIKLEVLKNYKNELNSSSADNFSAKNFFEKNSKIINRILEEDNHNMKEYKEHIMEKYKKLSENNNISKFYKDLKQLLDERTLLINFIFYYKDMNINYKKDLYKYQTSYDILASENEQIKQNNITLKKHIDFLSANENTQDDCK
ncbi:conserved Plasmodium protein, unknown function [Plasmodium malariae]|uniref:Uncharacterized protein n=1 Tax=Plasmodium malariae TaxID=5858 RepID=A0A1C3KF69_PLAMA|nr:conserved Plasmodium protein, unknown function [Plasmodium malariae]